MDKLRTIVDDKNDEFEQATVTTRFNIQTRNPIKDVCDTIIEELKNSADVIVISDYAVEQAYFDVNKHMPPVESIGDIHYCMIDEGLQIDIGLIVEIGSAQSTHHFITRHSES